MIQCHSMFWPGCNVSDTLSYRYRELLNDQLPPMGVLVYTLAGVVQKVEHHIIIVFFISNFMFYQLLHVRYSCCSTQSWSSVLPSIVETRDEISGGCPLLFLHRNLGSVCA